jgi:uncharacterized phage-like protein YoqJ
MKNVACFTGHRPNKLNGYDPKDNKELLWRIRNTVVELIEKRGVSTFINGLALGVDMWSAMIVLKLKEEYPHIKLISAVPCRNHSSKWNKESQNQWNDICEKSDEVVLVTDEEYKPYLMQVRNKWMVDKSDIIIAVWDGTQGGTANCINYAIKSKKEVQYVKVS